MAMMGRKKYFAKKPQGNYKRYQRRFRERRALDEWSPTAKGPLPPAIQRMFMRQSQQQANQWAKPRQQAINQYTNALAGQLAPVADRVGGYYEQAQQGQAASDSALSAMLAGQGQQVAGDLQAQLAAAGQNTGGLQAGQVGQGSAGAAYAMGSANLGRLLAQGAAAQTSAGQLPGIARLGGLQHTRELQGQAQTQAQQAFQGSLDRELEKWISRTGLGQQKRELRENRRQFNVGTAEARRNSDRAWRQDIREGRADAREQTRGEREDKLKSVTERAGKVARGLDRHSLTYGQALQRMRPWLKQRLPWLSGKRIDRLARQALLEGNFRFGGGLPGGGLPGGTTKPPGGGGGSGPGL